MLIRNMCCSYVLAVGIRAPPVITVLSLTHCIRSRKSASSLRQVLKWKCSPKDKNKRLNFALISQPTLHSLNSNSGKISVMIRGKTAHPLSATAPSGLCLSARQCENHTLLIIRFAVVLITNQIMHAIPTIREDGHLPRILAAFRNSTVQSVRHCDPQRWS